MNILILSSPNPTATAGVVAGDLAAILRQEPGYNVRLVVKEPLSNCEGVTSMDTLLSKRFSNINKRFTSLIQKIGLNRSVDLNIDTNYSVPELDLTKSIYTSKKFLDKAGFMPDVIIVLFMQNFVTCKNLYELNKLTGAPVILYFMDMAPMTGLCHYAWDCLNYQFECGNCPALHSTNADDISSQNFIYKKKYIGLTDLKLVSGCEYLVRQLKKSSLFKHLDVSKIFVPVMTGNKNNETPEKIKQMFNLPTDKKIIFIGANSVTNKRKGIKYLLDALSSLYRSGNDFVCNQIHIAVAGNSSGDIISQIDFPCTSIGHLKQDRLNLLYSGVDLFVSPSIEDSGPMMVNQAIISGTPVVAFAMGVAIDLVISGKTGYLAELKNVEDLRHGIEMIIGLSDNELQIMRQNCIQIGEEFHSTAILRSQWKNLIEKQ